MSPIGQKIGSIKKLRETLKAGGGYLIQKVPANGSITVRFMEEPEEWVNYGEHYDQTARRYFPCVEENCPGCRDESRRSSRYLANALDVEKDRVIALQLPKDLCNRLVIRYDKYGTLLDRDYELTRVGTSIDDTVYDATPEPAMPRKMAKYQPLDLQQVLDDSYNSVFAPNGTIPGAQTTDDDDDEEPPPTRTPRRAKKPPPKFKADQAAAQDDDDDDEDQPVPEAVVVEPEPEDDEEEDKDADDFYSESELQAMDLAALRTVAREFGIVTKGKAKAALIEEILADTGDEDEDDE